MGIQVKELTENLMPWDKEYIDFSFNGHHISEFGLVAATSGDRYSFDGSPDFSDETSEINGVMGQYYWGTKIKTKKYKYNLATDGMTEQQFSDFKRLFRPGYYGQFYEDTWWDRYCYVRIDSVVDFSFIPFRVEETVLGVSVQTRIYKGECKITLVQDKPFQFAFQQSLESTIEDLKNHPNTGNSQAALRMMYYSNIPASDSWGRKLEKCCIGSNMALASYGNKDDTSVTYKNVAKIPYYNPSTYDTECILKFSLNHSTTPVEIGSTESGGSTVVALVPEPIYFNEILDEYTGINTTYNVIATSFPIAVAMGEVNDKNFQYSKVFKYSLPETFEQVNKAIKIAYDYYQLEEEGAAVSLEERLREELVNGKVLSWAANAIQTVMKYDGKEYFPELYIPDDNEDGDGIGTFTDQMINIQLGPIGSSQGITSAYVNWFSFFNIIMLSMFVPVAKAEILYTDKWYDSESFYDYTITVDSEKGTCLIDYDYNSGLLGGIVKNSQTDENCSNIVLSEYLTLDGGDKISTVSGKINSYHNLVFRRDNEDFAPNTIELKYKYTYM